MRHLLLLLAVFLLPPSVSADNSASRRLIAEARILFYQGQESWESRIHEAAQIDHSSFPLIAYAQLKYEALHYSYSTNVQRLSAEPMMRIGEALKQQPGDPALLAAIKHLQEFDHPPLYKGNAEAAAAEKRASELQYGNDGNSSAVPDAHLEAMALDPKFSMPATLAGIWYLERKDYINAEVLLRKAVEIEPYNGDAWYYLAQTLGHLNRPQDALRAAQGAVVADPTSGFQWYPLERMIGGQRIKLRLTLPVATGQDKDGSPRYVVFPGFRMTCTADVDWVFWNAVVNATKYADLLRNRTFETDLKLWRAGIDAVSDFLDSHRGGLKDERLATLYRLAQKDQLDAAILLFTYKPWYRKDLDAWFARNPDAIAELMKMGVGP